MSSRQRGFGRTVLVAVRLLLVSTVLLGIVYPAVILGIGQLAFNSQANSGLISSGGKVVGSVLIGQSFSDAKGNPLPQWFQPRRSAAGKDYDATASGGTNLGPNSEVLTKSIEAARASIARFDGVSPASVPADAVTSSASGLDPHISPAYAREQVRRVAATRGLSEATVHALVERFIQGRDLGFMGEETVNVLQLNIALAKLG